MSVNFMVKMFIFQQKLVFIAWDGTRKSVLSFHGEEGKVKTIWGKMVLPTQESGIKSPLRFLLTFAAGKNVLAPVFWWDSRFLSF